MSAPSSRIVYSKHIAHGVETHRNIYVLSNIRPVSSTATFQLANKDGDAMTAAGTFQQLAGFGADVPNCHRTGGAWMGLHATDGD